MDRIYGYARRKPAATTGVKTSVRHIVVAAVCFLAAASYPVRTHGAVLVTETELRDAKANITREPLQGYFRKLSQGGDGGAAPFLYLLTGENRYAVRAKNTIVSNLESLRKYLPYKINIWTLQGPGWVESTVIAYDMTKSSGVYTADDIRNMKETLAWSVSHFMNEGKDHIGKGFLYTTDFIPEDHEDWVTANMNINRLVAVGLYALAFPEEPKSKELTNYTVNYFERVLSLGARPGGAWAESPRYASGVLRQLFTLAVALKNAGERNYLEDDRFRKLMGFFAESIPTPGMPGPDKPTMLAAGDTDWYENGTTVLSWAAPRYLTDEPVTAGEWMWCWKQSGAPLSPESLLFVNPGIEPVKPSYKSYLPGMGYVVFRDRFAEPDETFFFATFGAEPGTSNRTMHLHPNHGDFSLIWRGHPVMLTRGCASYVWSRRMRDQVDFSHSVVSCDGAGESIAIPEKKYSGPAIEVNDGIDETFLRDYYSDGLTNFLSTPGFDYAAGQVRNWDIGLPAPFNVRHFLFLKPDVFVIWDQVRSPYPLQWNLHLPAEDVTSSDKTIRITNSEGVNLSIDFLQDEPLDYTLDWPLESIRAEWPVVLSCPYGKGMFIFNALDITRQVLDYNHDGARKILENLISYPKRPNRIGLIGTDGQTAELLKRLGYSFELLDYNRLGGDLSGFDLIMVGHFGMLVRDRDLMDYREKLWKFVENGGVCYWAYEYAWGWKPGDISGPGYFPHTLMVGEGTSVLWGEGIELTCPITMDDDPVWQSPNRITMNDWDGWKVGPPDTYKMLHYNTKPNTDRARNIPVYYSDYWQVLASARRTYIINVPRTRKRFGPYRWIKVHHQPSDDYFAVVRAWEGSSRSQPAANILKGNERETVIRQGNDVWWVMLGNHKGQTGALALLRYDATKLGAAGERQDTLTDELRLQTEPNELFIVDSTEGSAGTLRFSFDKPTTFQFDFDSSEGRLMTLEGCTARLPWKLDSNSKFKIQNSNISIPAGDYSLKLSGGTLEMRRLCNVGQVEVVDGNGAPLQWVHIFRDLPGKNRTAFQGATDSNGRLSMRWEEGGEQGITLSKDKKSVRASIRPGMQRVVFK